MDYKEILMVVHSDFDRHHIGVRRVIRLYWKQLIDAGHNVTLATPIKGHLRTCSLLEASQGLLEFTHRTDIVTPSWKNGAPLVDAVDHVAFPYPFRPIDWSGKTVCTGDFDRSILMAPWICAQGFPTLFDQPFTAGVAYDMVPQMLSLGTLQFPEPVDAKAFAIHHDIGYEYMLHNAESIACISESTRNDFITLYGEQRSASKLDVCVPFNDFGNGTVQDLPPERPCILLVNALDVRKNFDGAAKALALVAEQMPVTVRVVGRRRVSLEKAMGFLSGLANQGTEVEWYEAPSDEQMLTLIKQSTLLFFPSIYEGCGLPILEAQANGVPVISSSNSSCGEVNQNNEYLTTLPSDYEGFAEKIIDVIKERVPFHRGKTLRNKQIDYLRSQSNIGQILLKQ